MTDNTGGPMNMQTTSRLDAAAWGVFDCTCCNSGCDCGCVELCPVGLDRHERMRQWLRERRQQPRRLTERP